MTRFVGLFSVVILLLLAFQAEPITALLGYAWAALHLIAILKNWYADRA